MTLREKFKKHLNTRGLTQKAFCDLSEDLDQPNISNIMNGKIIASARQAIAIHNITNGRISFHDLWEPWVLRKVSGEMVIPKPFPTQNEFRLAQRKK